MVSGFTRTVFPHLGQLLDTPGRVHLVFDDLLEGWFLQLWLGEYSHGFCIPAAGGGSVDVRDPEHGLLAVVGVRGAEDVSVADGEGVLGRCGCARDEEEDCCDGGGETTRWA